MKDENKCKGIQNDEIKELDDEQLESVNGGLGITTIGPVSLSALKTGQRLPEDTTFKPASTTSGASRRPKI